MCNVNSTTERPEATDALFSLEPADLAVRFGNRTKAQIQAGRDGYEAAKLAAHFGAQALALRPKVIGTITPSAPWGIQ